jgi:hypothetical protein
VDYVLKGKLSKKSIPPSFLMRVGCVLCATREPGGPEARIKRLKNAVLVLLNYSMVQSEESCTQIGHFPISWVINGKPYLW